jgi:hypothetical protein
LYNKNFFGKTFGLYRWTIFFQQHQASPIPIPKAFGIIKLSKQAETIFLQGALICSRMANIVQGLKGRVPKNKYVLLVESWIFNLFIFEKI